MDNLPFQNEEFDVIWSEGAIAISVLKRLELLERLSKKDGYIAVTYESWFTDERPTEIEKFWVNAVPEIGTIGHNISIMQKPVIVLLLYLHCLKMLDKYLFYSAESNTKSIFGKKCWK